MHIHIHIYIYTYSKQAAAELANVTKQNTEKLERVADLTAAQHRLEKELNSTQSRMVAEVRARTHVCCGGRLQF